MNRELAELVVSSWDDKKVLDTALSAISAGLIIIAPGDRGGDISTAMDIGGAAVTISDAALLLKVYREKKFGRDGISTLD